MQINLKSKNLELTDSIHVYVERKIGELEKLISGLEENPLNPGEHDTIMIDVEVGRTSKHHKKGDVFKAEVNIKVPNSKYSIHAKSEQWELHVAIDQVKDDLQRQLKRYKGKQRTNLDKGRRSIKKLLRLSKLVQKRDK